MIFFRDQFILMMYFISYFDIISAFTPKQEVPEGSDPKKLWISAFAAHTAAVNSNGMSTLLVNGVMH